MHQSSTSTLRNPLSHQTPHKRQDIEHATSTSPFRGTAPNFQYNQGARNWEYLSPTFTSSVFGGASPGRPQYSRTPNNRSPARHYRDNMTSEQQRVAPVERPQTAAPVHNIPVQRTPAVHVAPVDHSPAPVLRQQEPLRDLTPKHKAGIVHARNLEESGALAPVQIPHHDAATSPKPDRFESESQQESARKFFEGGRSVSPFNRTRRNLHNPADSNIFLGPDFSPRRLARQREYEQKESFSPVKQSKECAAECTESAQKECNEAACNQQMQSAKSQPQLHTPRKQSPQKEQWAGSPQPGHYRYPINPVEGPSKVDADGILCLVCANEGANAQQRAIEADLRRREKDLERQQFELNRYIMEEQQHQRHMQRESARQDYLNAKARMESKRQEIIDMKKPTAEEEASCKKQREDMWNNYQKIREDYAESIKKYKIDLDEQARNKHEARTQANLEEAQRDKERNGLPLGTYHWDFKDQLRSELQEQIKEKQHQRVESYLADQAGRQAEDESLRRKNESERVQKDEEVRVKKYWVAKMMAELKDANARNKQEKISDRERKRQDREIQEEMERRTREYELAKKAAIQGSLHDAYHGQMNERIQRNTAAKEAKSKEIGQKTSLHMKHSGHGGAGGCCHSPYCVCSRCHRRIPLNGAVSMK